MSGNRTDLNKFFTFAGKGRRAQEEVDEIIGRHRGALKPESVTMIDPPCTGKHCAQHAPVPS